MAWIATDEDGGIALYVNKPERQHSKTLILGDIEGYWVRPCKDDGRWRFIAESQSKELIGKVLTWEDEPVEIK